MRVAKTWFSDGEVGSEEEQGGKAKCTESNYPGTWSLAREEATPFTKTFLREIGFVGWIFSSTKQMKDRICNVLFQLLLPNVG